MIQRAHRQMVAAQGYRPNTPGEVSPPFSSATAWGGGFDGFGETRNGVDTAARIGRSVLAIRVQAAMQAGSTLPA
ncbi:MAG TPA: hypothetical protein VMV69_16130 [Pirellulales bacterium]|nr:hypothetical protein [Pirellulales bacterium]